MTQYFIFSNVHFKWKTLQKNIAKIEYLESLQKTGFLENEKSFSGEIKNIFHIFHGLSFCGILKNSGYNI